MKEKLMLGFVFKQIHIAFEAHCNKNLQKYNLTQAQMDILVYLQHHKDSTITQRNLEIGLGLKNPTVTGLLNRLEEKELINRKKHPNDKRSKIITMTEKSKIIMEEAYINMKEMYSSIVEGFSESEKEELFRLLYKVLDNLK